MKKNWKETIVAWYSLGSVFMILSSRHQSRTLYGIQE